MTSCRCGNTAVYRVIKRGITIPSKIEEFCNDCLRKDSWYAIHYHDYKIENIVQPETNVRILTYVNSDTAQQPYKQTSYTIECPCCRTTRVSHRPDEHCGRCDVDMLVVFLREVMVTPCIHD